MRTRIMSGAVLIVILFTCLYFGGWVTFGFSLFISLVGMYELIKVKKLEKTGLAVVGYIAAITYYFILLLNDPAYILLLLVASCILMMSVYVFTFPKYSLPGICKARIPDFTFPQPRKCALAGRVQQSRPPAGIAAQTFSHAG